MIHAYFAPPTPPTPTVVRDPDTADVAPSCNTLYLVPRQGAKWWHSLLFSCVFEATSWAVLICFFGLIHSSFCGSMEVCCWCTEISIVAVVKKVRKSMQADQNCGHFWDGIEQQWLPPSLHSHCGSMRSEVNCQSVVFYQHASTTTVARPSNGFRGILG